MRAENHPLRSLLPTACVWMNRHQQDVVAYLVAENRGRRRPRTEGADEGPKFTERFERILDDFGVEVVLTPVQAPNCNAHAERLVGSIKSEYLSRMILFGERSLVRAISEFIEHYHAERPHQGLGNEWIERREVVGDGDVVCSERLGGIHKHYRRAA